MEDEEALVRLSPSSAPVRQSPSVSDRMATVNTGLLVMVLFVLTVICVLLFQINCHMAVTQDVVQGFVEVFDGMRPRGGLSD